MLEPVRRFAVTRIKPLVRGEAWERARDLDPRKQRVKRERELDAEVNRRIRRRLRRAERRAAEETLLRTSEGLGLSPALRLLLDEVDQLLSTRPKAKIAIIVDDVAAVVPALILARYPRARITEVSAALDESARHVTLAAHGRYNVIIDAVADRTDPTALLLAVFYHLRREGHLGIADFRPTEPGPRALWPVLARALSRQSAPAEIVRTGFLQGEELPEGLGVDKPLARVDAETLARAIGRVVVGDGYLLVQNRLLALAKLREDEMAPLLEQTGATIGAVLEHVDGERFTPRSVIIDHGAVSVVRGQPDIVVPALELRSYRDVVCTPPQVVTKGNLLLVETYRHHQWNRMVNRMVGEVAPRFGTIMRNVSRQRALPGAYFHWDSEWPAHFGHVLSELVSRLWGLEAARAQYPDLKVLFGRRGDQTEPRPYERAILAAYGIGEDQIEHYARTVRVERLLAATPMFSMPQYVSPAIAGIWDRVGDAVVADASDAPTPRRFFCGRQRTDRSCHNSAEVEAVFAEHGFEIVYPEHLPFPDQLALFRNAEVVAGFAGSALFTLMFCPEPKRVVMVAPESYTANNEYLIGAVRGHTFDVFWSKPDTNTRLSSFTFDLDREGQLLREHLRSLG